MANSNPFQGRQAKRARRQPGDIAALRLKLWDVCERLHFELKKDKGITEEQLRHVHAFSQLSSVYIKATEVGELEARVEALEAAAKKSQAR